MMCFKNQNNNQEAIWKMFYYNSLLTLFGGQMCSREIEKAKVVQTKTL